MKKIFIDENINITEGDSAEKLLSERNDKRYLIENVGVLKVDENRWKEAQAYERKTWCDSPAKNMGTDRNEDHEKKFGGYNQLNYSLPNVINVIELGCGPFTNLRLILPQLFKKIENIDLLDPLIDDYIKNTLNCTYKNGYLNMRKVNLISSPIENYTTERKYDLVVMINVIEHCFDVDIIFDKINEIIKTGGIFVFHDKFLKEENVNEIHDRFYDSGHPLKLPYKYVKEKLNFGYKTLYNYIYTDVHNYENVYTILLKK
jgi:SAM-dependent methyltransferase